MSPDRPPSFAERLKRLIAAQGPICVAEYMALSNQHYYGTRDPFGPGGDFITAPEISQMFGELVGLCLADVWDRAGRPERARYVELGPGRGTLAADALRAMRAAGLMPAVHFVETSVALRGAQKQRVANAEWHDHLMSLPEDGPLLAVANEFFDALPARQLIATGNGWHERVVTVEEERLVTKAGPPVPASVIPAHLRGALRGTIVETSPTSAAVTRLLAHRLRNQGGVALIVDYGHAQTSAGDTLQAVKAHAFTSPWEGPGERDLTVHVDFETLAAVAGEGDVRVLGPVPQGAWLQALGIDHRSAALAAAAPQRRIEIESARDRLVSPEQMGTLFKALALVAPGWPDPAGLG